MARIIRGPKRNITHVYYGKKFRAVTSVSEVKAMLSDLSARVSGLMSGRSLAEAKRSQKVAKTFEQTYNSELEAEGEGREHFRNDIGDPYRHLGNSDPHSRQDEGG